MASNKEYRFNYEEKDEAEEPKMPVFTVLKNGAILKNIFIVNNNSPFSNPNPPPQSSQIPNQDNEEIVTVGRHPNSHIMLTHPSISRSHLHILSNPSSHTLYVFDLGSTHGTWVCDERIEPRVRVELKEGDTLRVGASTRVYRLHWIPLSRAYHFENPPQVLASMDVAMAEEKGGNGVAEEENSMEVCEDEKKSLPIEEEITLESENCLGGESQEIQSLDSIVKEINSLFSDESLGSISGLNLEENAVTEHENAMEGYADKKSLQIENKPVEDKDTFAVERKGGEIFESENSLGAERKGEEIFESEHSLRSERKGEEIFESENYLGAESQEIQSLDSIEAGLNSLFFDKYLGSVVKMAPSAPPMPENLVFTLYDENEELYESPLKDVGEQNEILSQRDEPLNFPLHVAGITLESENPENDVEEFSSKGLEKEKEKEADLTAELPGETGNEIPFLDDHKKLEKTSLPVGEVIGETGNQEIGIESLVPEPDCLLLSQSHQGKQEGQADHPASEGLENEDQMVSLNHPVGEVSWEIENQEVGIEKLTLESVGSLHLLSHQRKEETLTPEQKLSSVVNLDSVFLNEAEHSASEGLEIEDHMAALNHPVGEIIGETKSQEIGIEDLNPEPVHSLHLLSHQAKQESLTPEQKLSSVVDLNSAFLNEADHPSEGLENEDPMVSSNGHGKDGTIKYSSPSMTESVNLSLPGDEVFWEFTDDKANQMVSLNHPVGEVSWEIENQEVGIEKLTPESVGSLHLLSHQRKEETLTPEQKLSSVVNLDSVFLNEAEHSASEGLEIEDHMAALNHPVGEIIGETKSQEIGIEDLNPEPVHSLHLLSHQAKQESLTPEQKLSSVVDLNSAFLNEADHPSEGLENEDPMVSPNGHGKDGTIKYSSPSMTESVNLSLPGDEVFWEFTDDKANQTPQSLFAATCLPHVEKLSSVVDPYSECSNEADHPASEGLETNEDQNVSMKVHEQKDVLVEYSAQFITEYVNSSLPSEEDLLNITYNKENQTPRSLFAATHLPRVEKLSSMVDLNSACYDEADHPASKGLEKNEDHNVFVEDHEHKDALVEYSAPFMAESAKSSLLSKEDLLEITDDKENQTPQYHVSATRLPQVETSSPVISDKMSSFGSIWSRRGKPASVLQIQTGWSGRKSKKHDVHAEVERHNGEDTKDKSISKELFSCLSEEEEEIFTPDKENFAPNTLILKSLKKMGKLEEMKHFESCRSSISNITIRSSVHPEGHLSPDKNNQTTGILKERKSVKPTSDKGNPVLIEQGFMIKKKRRPERVPFQSLTVNSASKTISEALGPKTATRTNASDNYTQTMVKKVSSPLSNKSVQDNNKRGWIMVVDTATLLDKKSRKYLELLQGLKGTHLIIPRMVLTELDCLKQRGRLFSRKTEASLVLEWIEECMVKTNWWVNVQSSEEDRRLTAPTPLAYPQSPFSDGSDGFTRGTRPLLSLRSIMEIVSPTAEDHILDCALLCRETKSDKQLVILSDDVTLKIKAMAEGLICEPVKEFRESLVNPFSERFLWTDSSPRGLTWSYLDDIILREKYNRCPLKNSSKGENAKGLKLILLHNSHYRQITPIS